MRPRRHEHTLIPVACLKEENSLNFRDVLDEEATIQMVMKCPFIHHFLSDFRVLFEEGLHLLDVVKENFHFLLSFCTHFFFQEVGKDPEVASLHFLDGELWELDNEVHFEGLVFVEELELFRFKKVLDLGDPDQKLLEKHSSGFDELGFIVSLSFEKFEGT